MAIAFVKSAEGVSAVAVTTPAFGTATTSGNLLVLAFASDDYNGTPNASWTESSEMGQDTGSPFHGSYLWWKISTGETTLPTYTIGSATVSCWIAAEFSGNDAAPYDTSQGQFVNSTGNNYTSALITPTTGQRLLVNSQGGSKGSDNSTVPYTTWLNSFTRIDDIGTTAGATDDCIGMAYRIVTGNGTTTFSSGATYGAPTQQCRSSLIISFKEAAAAATKGIIYNPTPQMHILVR